MAQNSKENEKLLSILTHISGIFIGFIGPLIFYLVAEEKQVKEHSKKALNWQLSVLIYSIVAAILIFVIIGLLLLPAIMIANLIFSIIAAIKASEQKVWDYPLAIPFLK